MLVSGQLYISLPDRVPRNYAPVSPDKVITGLWGSRNLGIKSRARAFRLAEGSPVVDISSIQVDRPQTKLFTADARYPFSKFVRPSNVSYVL
jgi:hypothetical protein